MERRLKVCVQEMGLLENCKPCNTTSAYAITPRQCVEAPPGYEPNATGNGYIACAMGSYRSSKVNTTCTPCDVGGYTNTLGAAQCTPCAAGKYQSATNKTNCQTCPNGHVSTQMGATACTRCSAAGGGYRSNWNRVECEACPMQTWQAPGTTTCDVCHGIPSGLAAATACTLCTDVRSHYQSGGCVPCAPGQLWDEVTKDCVTCSTYHDDESGLYYNDASNASLCKPCQRGYQASNDQSRCEPCPAGTGGVAHTGRSMGVCQPCIAGNFSTDGVCMACRAGTYASSAGSTGCTSCAPGRYSKTQGATQCTLCAKGTFGEGGVACTVCGPSSFMPYQGASACMPRGAVSCGENYVRTHETAPDRDDGCARCLVCQTNQFFRTTSTGLLQRVTVEGQSSLLKCNGTTYEPPFECVDNVPVAGKYYVDSSLQQGGYVACPALPRTGRVEFVAGPDMTRCYVGCSHGMSKDGRDRYYKTFGYTITGGLFRPGENYFLQDLVFGDPKVEWDRLLCTACPTGPCELAGRYRPNKTLECGPACLLHPEQCTEPDGTSNEGCNGYCEPRGGQGFSYTMGSATMGDPQGCAPYRICAAGYHLSNDNSLCEPCPVPAQTSVASFCGSPWFYLRAYQECLTTHRTFELCLPCPIVANATMSTNATRCDVVCDAKHFFNGSMCLACADHVPSCAAGTYADMATCDVQHTRPECKPCHRPLGVEVLDFVTNGGTSVDGCRVRCKAGYHTRVDFDDGYASGPNVSLSIVHFVGCQPCYEEESRSCASVCASGQFRNLSVPDGRLGSCVHCRVSSTCPSSHFAPACSGAETLDAPCLPCPRLTLPNVQYVPYSARWVLSATLLQADHCPTACVNNHIPSNYGGGCVRCAGLTPFAHWNASLDKQGRSRSDRCWACDMGYTTEEDDKVLCFSLFHF